MRALICFAVLLLCSCGAPPPAPSTSSKETPAASDSTESAAKRRHRNRHRGAASASADTGTAAGKFDFYLMSFSWSPGFCATAAGRSDTLQCGQGRQFSFVLHGLWPEYLQGGWPQDCSTEAADQTAINSILNIMPSAELAAHEWLKHGTCSGLSPKDYFEEAEDAFHSVQVPAQYQAPVRQVNVSPSQLQQDFVAANPKMSSEDLVVVCSSNGRYLQEVRFCLTPDLEARACNAETLREACKSDQVIMRPVK